MVVNCKCNWCASLGGKQKAGSNLELSGTALFSFVSYPFPGPGECVYFGLRGRTEEIVDILGC